MKKLKFRISPLFLLLGALMFYFKMGHLFLAYLIAILLHEFGHACVAKKLGYELNQIKLMPYGTELSIEKTIDNLNDDLIISLSGPFVNLILIVCNLALWWLFPATYIYTEVFVYANAISLLFNLLPVFPLDGGRVALNLLSRKIEQHKAYSYLKVWGDAVAILFFLLFLISAFYQINFTLFFISFFLISGNIEDNKNSVYKTIFTFSVKKINLKRPKNVKTIAISENTTLLKTLRLINSHYFTVFYVLDHNLQIKRTLTQEQLKTLALNNPPTKSLNEII